MTIAEETPEEELQPTMHKKFTSSDELRFWLHSPVNMKLYEVLYVNWTRNTVKLEGRPMPPL